MDNREDWVRANWTVHPSVFWGGLCIASESNQPHEWPYLANVITNRLDKKNRFGNTIFEVVTQRYQFSYFNQFGPPVPNQVYAVKLLKGGYLGNNLDRLTDALHCMQDILYARKDEKPFGPNVFYFWSPRSMSPVGSIPKWNFRILRCFDMSGVDPYRFVFAEEVNTGHPLSNNVFMYDFSEEVT